jgi:hypothetical protein
VQKLNVQRVRTLYVDLTAIEGSENTPEEWYLSLVRTFCRGLSLNLDERSWWKKRERLGPIQRFTEFLQQVVLEQIKGPIVVFIDEIDSTLKLPFTDDFFAVIRAMYNQRSTNEENKRLTFVLAGVARPTDLIKDTRSTPYNIGTLIDLADFTREDAKGLLKGLEKRHPADLSKRLLERILHWTGGHPYLTQKLCAEVVRLGHGTWSSKQVDALVEQLFFQKSRIRQDLNLQWIDTYVCASDHREELLDIYGKILSGKPVQDDDRSLAKSRLKLSGLVKVTAAGQLRVRNRIYGRVFGPQWAGISTSRQGRSRLAFSLVPAVLLVVALSIVAYRALVRPARGTPTVALTTAVPTTTTAPSHTPEPTPTEATLTPTATKAGPTPTPTPTTTEAPPTPTLMPTATGAPPTPTPTPTATKEAPLTPTPTLIATEEASPTVGPTPTPVDIIPMEGTARATRWASIYAYPNQAPYDNNKYSVGPGQSVQLLGQAAAPWNKWLYVRRERPDLEGFVWGPWFEILPKLKLTRYEKKTFCAQGEARFGFEVQVAGGDSSYTFLWGDQPASAVETSQDGVYLVSWAWKEVSLRVGKLSVLSGDGQKVSTVDCDFIDQQPSCN